MSCTPTALSWTFEPCGYNDPPTALTTPNTPVGRSAAPLDLAPYHLGLPSSTERLTEAEWLTTLSDKNLRPHDGHIFTERTTIA